MWGIVRHLRQSPVTPPMQVEQCAVATFGAPSSSSHSPAVSLSLRWLAFRISAPPPARPGPAATVIHGRHHRFGSLRADHNEAGHQLAGQPVLGGAASRSVLARAVSIKRRGLVTALNEHKPE